MMNNTAGSFINTLFRNIKKGNEDAVREAICKQYGLDDVTSASKNNNNNTISSSLASLTHPETHQPLMFNVVRCGAENILKMLIEEFHVSPEALPSSKCAKDKNGNGIIFSPPFLEAIRLDDDFIIRYFLMETEVELCAVDERSGQNFFHFLAKSGSLAVLEFMLEDVPDERYLSKEERKEIREMKERKEQRERVLKQRQQRIREQLTEAEQLLKDDPGNEAAAKLMSDLCSEKSSLKIALEKEEAEQENCSLLSVKKECKKTRLLLSRDYSSKSSSTPLNLFALHNTPSMLHSAIIFLQSMLLSLLDGTKQFKNYNYSNENEDDEKIFVDEKDQDQQADVFVKTVHDILVGDEQHDGVICQMLDNCAMTNSTVHEIIEIAVSSFEVDPLAYTFVSDGNENEEEECSNKNNDDDHRAKARNTKANNKSSLTILHRAVSRACEKSSPLLVQSLFCEDGCYSSSSESKSKLSLMDISQRNFCLLSSLSKIGTTAASRSDNENVSSTSTSIFDAAFSPSSLIGAEGLLSLLSSVDYYSGCSEQIKMEAEKLTLDQAKKSLEKSFLTSLQKHFSPENENSSFEADYYVQSEDDADNFVTTLQVCCSNILSERFKFVSKSFALDFKQQSEDELRNFKIKLRLLEKERQRRAAGKVVMFEESEEKRNKEAGERAREVIKRKLDEVLEKELKREAKLAEENKGMDSDDDDDFCYGRNARRNQGLSQEERLMRDYFSGKKKRRTAIKSRDYDLFGRGTTLNDDKKSNKKTEDSSNGNNSNKESNYSAITYHLQDAFYVAASAKNNNSNKEKGKRSDDTSNSNKKNKNHLSLPDQSHKKEKSKKTDVGDKTTASPSSNDSSLLKKIVVVVLACFVILKVAGVV